MTYTQHLPTIPAAEQLLEAICRPSEQLLAVVELDAELAELQELDRRAWLRERVAAPASSISWPPVRG